MVWNTFPIVLVGVLTLALSAVGPVLFVPDSWMTLVAGREVWTHGIPRNETLTVMSAGDRWIDQQWLAQLVYYGAERIGGLGAVAALSVLVSASALAIGVVTARLLGASARSTFLVGAGCVFVAPWAWQIRAQGLALPLFALTLLLATTHVRSPSRRIWLALPVLLVWGNVHGSVVLGAGIVSLAALGTALGKRHQPRALLKDVGVVPLAWLAALVTPYGWDIVDYYRLMLFDPPFAGLVLEWQRTRPTAITAVFFVVAALSTFVCVRHRRRLTWFELALLVLSLAGALQAVRGVVWFALVVVAVVPNAVDGLFARREMIAPRRLNLTIVGAVTAAATVAFAANLLRTDERFQELWPTGSLQLFRSLPSTATVFPSDRHSDWILWRVPELRGHVAYDVRFELLTRDEVLALARYTSTSGDSWAEITDGYHTIVLDRDHGPSSDELLEERAEGRVVYGDEWIDVVSLRP